MTQQALFSIFEVVNAESLYKYERDNIGFGVQGKGEIQTVHRLET
jgi:hypothetical protein